MSQRDPQAATLPPQQHTDRFCFIQEGWHADIVNQGSDAFLAEMARQDVPHQDIDLLEVPGAFEIPLRAQALARSGQYAAIVACALVVDGGIYRHDFVASAVVDALMRVQLDSGVPVLSVVLTPHAFHAHDEHQRFFGEHFVAKGREAARACVQVLSPGYLQALATV